MSDSPASTAPAPAPEITAAMAAEHVRDFSFVGVKRPYEVTSPMQLELGGGASLEKLPEPGHWRLSVTGSLDGRDASGESVFKCTCTVEAVIVLQNFQSPAQVREIMATHYAGQLLGTVRSRIQSSSYLTGYGAVLFPVLNYEEMARFTQDIQASQV